MDYSRYKGSGSIHTTAVRGSTRRCIPDTYIKIESTAESAWRVCVREMQREAKGKKVLHVPISPSKLKARDTEGGKEGGRGGGREGGKGGEEPAL